MDDILRGEVFRSWGFSWGVLRGGELYEGTLRGVGYLIGERDDSLWAGTIQGEFNIDNFEVLWDHFGMFGNNLECSSTLYECLGT